MKKTFEDFLIEKLSHLGKYYKTEQEFIDHLKSGDVTIPFTDVVEVVNEYLKSNHG